MTSRRDSWFKFYPQDWLDGTRHMTLEQRGAYFDMICLQMALGGPIPDDVDWMRHQLHVSRQKARRMMDALCDGLAKLRRDDGKIWNDRAQEEIDKREHQRQVNTAIARHREAVKSGDARQNTEKSSKKVGGNSAVPDRFDNDAHQKNVTKSTTRNPVRATILDIDKEEEDKTLAHSASPTCASAGELFEDGSSLDTSTRAKPRWRPSESQWAAFWDAYPRRKDKQRARASFFKLTADEVEAAIFGATRYAVKIQADKTDERYVAHAATWLNGKRWEDFTDPGSIPDEVVDGKRWGWWREPAANGRPKADGMRRLSPERWREGFAATRPNGRWPWWKFGAPPGHAECVVPNEILEETGWIEVYQGKEYHI